MYIDPIGESLWLCILFPQYHASIDVVHDAPLSLARRHVIGQRVQEANWNNARSGMQAFHRSSFKPSKRSSSSRYLYATWCRSSALPVDHNSVQADRCNDVRVVNSVIDGQHGAMAGNDVESAMLQRY